MRVRRAWIHANLGPFDVETDVGVLRNDRNDEEELRAVSRDRVVQRMLFDAGFAGVCIPPEYGGQGLTPPYQQVLNEELAGFEYPSRFQAPTFSPCLRGAARVRHRSAEARAHPRHPQR